jgi:hypothetical protein
MVEHARTSIEQQATTLFETVDDANTLVSQFEFGSMNTYEDRRTGWHHKYSLEALVRVMYVREFTGYTWQKLHDHISEDERAVKLGFDPQKFADGQSAPARTTLSRAWSDYFGPELKRYISNTAKWVLEIAHEQGNPLGMRSLEPEDKRETSPRTQTRFIRKKTHEVTDEMRRLVFPQIKLKRPDKGTQYEDAAFLTLQSLMGLTGAAAEQASTMCADDWGDNEVPDSDTHLHYLKQLTDEQILKFTHNSIEVMLAQAKRHLEFDRPVELAFDITYVAYYGERDELVMVSGAPDSKQYDWCYKFATASIVGNNVKFTLALRPVQKGETYGEIVRDLYWAAREYVSIRRVYADRAFFSADVLLSLQETGSEYIIPARKNSRIKSEIRRMTHDVKVNQEWVIHGDTEGGPTNTPVETTLALVPSTKKEDTTVAFATNMDIDDEISLDRRETKGLMGWYSRRWGIENSYKTIKDFLAWTTSKEFPVRLFYFGFAVLLYNMWLLVDFVVQVSLDCVEQRTKPRITAKRFLAFVRRSLLTAL